MQARIQIPLTVLEVIDYLKEEWDGLNDVALTPLDWVHWYNTKRLHSKNDYLFPLEKEDAYYRSLIPMGQVA